MISCDGSGEVVWNKGLGSLSEADRKKIEGERERKREMWWGGGGLEGTNKVVKK